MYTGHRIQKRTRTQSSSSAAEADLFRHRPLSNETDPTPADLENQETPNLQAQSERAARFGHNFSRVKVQDSTPAVIQPKLAIGAPGDKYEQEADSVAAQVMSMNAPASQQSLQRQATAPEEEEVQMKPLASMITPLVQRQETAPEEEELQAKPLVQREEAPEDEELQAKPLVQRQEAPEDEELQAKPLVQRQEAPEEEQLQAKRSPDGNSHASNNLESQLGASKGSGSPLPDDVRSFMEPRFGADFSQVRVHTDSQAVQMNQAVGAQAFTHGSDIYFGEGKSPAISDLTAHELTHVVQQTCAIQAAPGSGAVKKKEDAKKKKEEQEKKKLEEMKTILDASATGKEALKLMEDHKVAVKFKPGGGSYFDSSSNSMVIDSHETAANSALTFVHEMNHARYHHEGLSADVTSLSREDYVKKMVEEEAEGTVKSIEAKIELEGTKIDVSKASFPLEKEYRKAYKASIDAAKAKLPKRGLIGTMIDEAKLLIAARIAGKERVIKGFMDGEVVTSNTKEAYSKYYGKYWDKVNKKKKK
ncbi:eCIS core domain-containing protein [Allocoleopsis sp.]|uniref:eCIS core domain-containing protein n=1 Tax=Allocoleopsis sp. TaxID=3088169 RepID=UPI002FD76852